MSKTHVGILEVDQVSSLPNLKANRGGFGFESTTPKYWDGTSWSSFSGTGSGISTWDELYDTDKAMVIDEATGVTWTKTAAAGDAFTLAGGAASTGDLLQFSNAGSGSDIKGTSDTWSVSSAGALLVTSIAHPTTDTALAIDANGSGKISLGTTSTGVIELLRSVTMPASKSLTMAGVDGSNILVLTAGDVSVANGSVTVVDTDNAVSIALTNNTVTTAGLIAVTSTSLTTGDGLLMTANGLTSGNMISLVTTASGLTSGKYISVNDGSVRWSIAADGATLIATGVNSTKALEITGIQTSENVITVTSSGVTADDKAIMLINSSGNSAAGSNQIRIAPSGTPVEASVGIEFVGASKLMRAMVLDGDSVDNSVVAINGGGALASDKAVLEVTNDGNLASGGNLARFSIGGTPNAAAIGIEVVGAGKALTALYVDSDPTASSTAVINGGGVLTNGFAVLTVSSDGALASGGNTFKVATAGTPASGAMYAEFDFTGITDTNENVGVKIDATGKKVQALSIIAAPIANSVALIQAGAALAADKAVVEIVSVPTTNNADSAVVRLEQTHTAGGANILHMVQNDVDKPFIGFETTVGTGNAIQAVAALNLTATHYIMVDIEGVGTRYFAVGTLA